jgi:hypothetical protein
MGRQSAGTPAAGWGQSWLRSEAGPAQSRAWVRALTRTGEVGDPPRNGTEEHRI